MLDQTFQQVTQLLRKFLVDLLVVDIETQFGRIENADEDQAKEGIGVERRIDRFHHLLRIFRPESGEKVQQTNDHRALRLDSLSIHRYCRSNY